MLPNDTPHFGATLRRMLEDRGLSITEASKQMGFQHRYLQRVVNGERGISRQTLFRIINFLELEGHEAEQFRWLAGYTGRDTVLFRHPLIQQLNEIYPRVEPKGRPSVEAALRLALDRAMRFERLPVDYANTPPQALPPNSYTHSEEYKAKRPVEKHLTWRERLEAEKKEREGKPEKVVKDYTLTEPNEEKVVK